MLELASDSLLRGEYEEIGGWAARAVEARRAARRSACRRRRAHAMQALAAAMRGAVPEAAGSSATRAAERIDDLTDDGAGPAASTASSTSRPPRCTLDRFEASGRHAERALAVGRATGQGELFPLIFPMLGTALWVQGRIAEAARIFDDAVEAARMRGQLPGTRLAPLQPLVRGRVAGDAELALATARESMRSRRASTTASSRLMPPGRSPWPCWRPARRSRLRIC